MSTHIKFSQIVDFDRVDDRVAIVNQAFANLIGMNDGFIEFLPEENPPSCAELIALAWLVNPTANPPDVQAGANAYFVELVREQYERKPEW